MKSLVRFLLFLFFILLVVAGFLFTINNTAPVELWFGHDFAARPLGVWMLFAFAAGALLGLGLGAGIWRHLRYRARLYRLQQRLAGAERELLQARQAPAGGSGEPGGR